MTKKTVKHSQSGARNVDLNDGRGGQAMIFMVIVLLIVFVAILWMADVHRIVFTKDRSQNAGDAAALAGARWQGTTLNLIGELNLMHAAALAAGDSAAVDLVTNTQKRLAFTGPMTGVVAAQQGAKLNGAHVNEEFTQFVREHANTVRNGYDSTVGGSSAMPEPWPGAWAEYASMLDAVADDGVAAGIDNAFLFSDPSGAHLLLQIEFYDAIAARDWCWFFRVHPDLLEEYDDYGWWPSLPPRDTSATSSSEFLGLWLVPSLRTLGTILAVDGVHDAAQRLSIDIPAVTNPVMANVETTWFYYNPDRWGRWDAMDAPFPIDGDVKPEYDYAGADSAMRVESEISRFTQSGGGTEARDRIVWTGASKPFGYLEVEGDRVNPTESRLVLPAFREVRLIPMDASSASSGGSFDLAWRRHCAEHVPEYLSYGLAGVVGGCRYCRNLTTWERVDFRQSGVSWLSSNSWQCVISNPGGSPGGGTRRAH